MLVASTLSTGLFQSTHVLFLELRFVAEPPVELDYASSWLEFLTLVVSTPVPDFLLVLFFLSFILGWGLMQCPPVELDYASSWLEFLTLVVSTPVLDFLLVLFFLSFILSGGLLQCSRWSWAVCPPGSNSSHVCCEHALYWTLVYPLVSFFFC
ncbi:hypothetical protein F5Y17DRAFT_189520 [Xylariaceae sp. FL0594]|nr:hypothetical protein F5Y17DRAFT_189520 [Xylariaceae sp. FL0594]